MIEITLLFETPLQWRSNVPLLTGGWYLHPYLLRKMTKCCALLVLTGSATHPCLAGECTNQQGVNFGRGILYSCLKLSMDGARRRASQEKPVSAIKWLGHTLEENTLWSKTFNFRSCFCTKWMESYKGNVLFSVLGTSHLLKSMRCTSSI